MNRRHLPRAPTLPMLEWVVAVLLGVGCLNASADEAKSSKAEACPSNVALARATYRAQQVPGAVLIFAEGAHIQAGYEVFFEQLPIEIFPPQFALWDARPADDFPYAATTFSRWTMFLASAKVEQVFVHDAAGKHAIDVEQVPDLETFLQSGKARKSERGGGGGGTPFRSEGGGDGGAPLRYASSGEGPHPWVSQRGGEGPGSFLLQLGGEGPSHSGNERTTPWFLSTGEGGPGTWRGAMLGGLTVGLPVGAIAKGDDPIIKMTIGAFVETQPQLEKLEQHLKKAGLLERLKQPGKLTLLAPTNRAFQQLPLDAIKLLNDPAKREEMLKYHHYTHGAMKLNDIRHMRSLHMENGLQVWVHGTEQRVWLRDQASRRIDFLQTDIVLSNGLLHLVDLVMWPWEVMPLQHELSSEKELARKADLITSYQVTPFALHVNSIEHAIHTMGLKIRIRGSKGTGEIQPDASTCKKLDNFGEPSDCNAGVLAPMSVELSQVYATDLTGKGRALFQVRCAQIGENLLLVVPVDSRDSYRLVVKDMGGDAVHHVLTLENNR